MRRITIKTDNEEQDSNNNFIESHFQLNEIGQPPDNLYILNNGDSGKILIFFFLKKIVNEYKWILCCVTTLYKTNMTII
jgi:hypothetical protein